MKSCKNGPKFNNKLIKTFYENCFDSNYFQFAGAEHENSAQQHCRRQHLPTFMLSTCKNCREHTVHIVKILSF